MSGIYGIYRYDGGPVSSEWMERMRSAIAYYGPNGGGSKIEGSVGMGHLLLEINPEDAFESQPVSGERGPVVSAARLDNRDDLLNLFGYSSSEGCQISDGHLVSLAFDRWGEEICSHIQGDWSLAAWDHRERRLLLARNPCGQSTFYYYEGKGFIAFASHLKALLALPGVTKEADYLRLAQVLVAWQNDPELTAYKGFRRLPWAHAMSVGPNGQNCLWRHWSPEGRPLIFYRKDEEYEEAFLEYYTRAVRNCLRSSKPIASMLSGGRDSGSLVALAAPILASQGRELTAYTSVPCLPPDGAGNRSMGNEWELAHATATMAGNNVQHLPIDAANYGVLQGIEYFLDVHEGPSHAASNHFWIQALAKTAAKNGAGVVLTGRMGNATISWAGNGSALLALHQGNPSIALQLLLHTDTNPWRTLKRQILSPLLFPGRRAWNHYKTHGRKPWQAYSALNPNMALSLNLDGQMQAAGYDATFTRSPLVDIHPLFYGPPVGADNCISVELAARNSLAYLDPTGNIALAEFILRVPDDQFCKGGRSGLFQRALRNRLPEPVLKGRKKGLQAADVGHRILQEQSALRKCLYSLDALPIAREMLDLPHMHRCLENLVAKVDQGSTARAGSILLRGLGVGIFLRDLDGY
jgi:asparagine synthase (glutamine-hydrolysing)